MLLEEQQVGLILVRDYRFFFLAFHILCYSSAVRMGACVYRRAHAQLYRVRVLSAVKR